MKKVILVFILLGSFIVISSCKPKTQKMPELPQSAEQAPIATAQQKLGTVKLQEPSKSAGSVANPEEQQKTPEEAETSKGANIETEEIPSMPAPKLGSDTEKQTAAEVAFSPKVIREAPSVEILLDASGSMNAPYQNTNRIKMEIVKNAVIEAVQALSDNIQDFPRNIAIRTFGSEKEVQDHNCDDTKLTYPLSKPDVNDIIKKVNEITAKGMSPTALALEHCGSDMSGSTGDKLIVLITDGSDNCGGSIDNSIELLNRMGQKWIINIVGFDLSPEDQTIAKSVVEKTSGKLYLARTIDELHAGVEQAINSSLPYNLRLVASAAGIPVPVEFTIFKGGSDMIIKKDKSYGTKLLLLDPGNYDILVEYMESPETKRPSKIIKGVEITAQTKIEQNVDFDLAGVGISSVDDKGFSAPASVRIFDTQNNKMTAEFKTTAERQVVFITPGTYNLDANLLTGDTTFTILKKDIALPANKTTEIEFVFQKGTVVINGETSQKRPIAFIYKIFRSDQPDKIVASGALPSGGGSVELYPGQYDILLEGNDPSLPSNPTARIGEVTVKSGETSQTNTVFRVGTLNILAVSPKGTPIPAIFDLYDEKTNQPMGQKTSLGETVSFFVPPSTYRIHITSIEGSADPKPTTTKKGVIVTEDKPTDEKIKFEIGLLRLKGINTKGQPLTTKFIIFYSGTDEIASSAPESADWIEFPLSPGSFDIQATQITGPNLPSSSIMIRDIEVPVGKVISLDAIFTTGKIKVIGRTANNELITCSFKVFKYGADREIINGSTTDSWEMFPIDPGNYYMEASYNDEMQDVVLKKWINFEVKENEIKEIVLNF